MKDIVADYLRNYKGMLPDLYNWALDEKILLDRFGIDVSRTNIPEQSKLEQHS